MMIWKKKFDFKLWFENTTSFDIVYDVYTNLQSAIILQAVSKELLMKRVQDLSR